MSGESKRTGVEQILLRAVADEQFREQLINDFGSATKDYDLTPEDLEALEDAYNQIHTVEQPEVLTERENPAYCCSCCCCCV
jgi:tRNA 2-selenouridine synthase SelU